MYHIFIPIIFIFLYIILKCTRETFINNSNSYNIRINKPIFLKNKNLFNVVNNPNDILLKKTNDLYVSNEYITNYSNNIGFIFKPLKFKNIKVGLSYLDDLDYYFNFIGNNFFKIEELANRELENEKLNNQNYIIEELDYCFNTNITECKTKSLFKYKDDDLFCMLIENNTINYIIIKNYNTENQLGILLHKSKKLGKLNKLYMFISNNKYNNKISDLFWINKNIDFGDELKNIKWSLSYLSDRKYNRKKLPKQEKLYGPAPSYSKSKEKEIYFPSSARKIIIDTIILNKNNNFLIGKNNYLNINLLYHNISLDYLKSVYSIDTIIYFKDKKVIIPFIKDYNYYYRYVLLKININEYINIIKNEKVKIQVLIRPFKVSTDTFNLKSNIKDFQINF